jgi:hypothetical protein
MRSPLSSPSLANLRTIYESDTSTNSGLSVGLLGGSAESTNKIGLKADQPSSFFTLY